MEFHISRQARDRYQLDDSLFSFNGSIIFANFHAVRLFVQKINQKRDLVNYPERAVQAGQINALGLIDEIFHFVLHLYLQEKRPDLLSDAAAWLDEKIGPEIVDKALLEFTNQFPPVDVYRRALTAEQFLADENEGTANREAALEEMIILWITNRNPAAEPYRELFNDETLTRETGYHKILQELYSFFQLQPRFGPDQQNLIDMLRAPAVAVPNSLNGQLEFIRERWAELLGSYLYRLLSSLDLIKEETKMGFTGPGPVPIPVYDRAQQSSLGEVEAFSPDRDWMPNVVIMAKNTYVWLDQLSRTYQQEIRRLDQIPDEELDRLARSGFTGLWLIGLWERSAASARIKQLCGNPDAIASAYSLSDYSIAADLGGDAAYQNLRDRAWRRGIRLASDMVPNHMGVDSSWVINHPDWFVSLPYSPYPSYSFNGPNLSSVEHLGLYLEDHYFDRSDAAVVFKRVDFQSGDTRFIYHGNDGTSMPWNDTAQLDYLNPKVREAVIQTILSVARRFPIIRFDAAMTLAKMHYQRLWYPEPGSGGAIPSRSDYALPRNRFDEAMPVEFWREVVDRCAVEAPDTLLLAEAFWMMEGYFVRTLGMHRVYNSAFMNMLRNEENDRYRQLIKNTLEFDPEILKRYVNFMNNPDERTAVDQFGKGDKYFGICILMSTMPGLPMFGHGQIEGFAEKYGMEFRRAMWDEQADPYLVSRHEREISPLLHKRSLFAGVENFLLYDFFTSQGQVDENVFAYSNRRGDDFALVVYHNKFAQTAGWIKSSCTYLKKSEGEKRMTRQTLGEALQLHPSSETYLVFRDLISGLEFIHPTRQVAEQGLHFDLGAYKYQIFVDFREVQEDAYQSYQHLCQLLNGRGVPSVEGALREVLLQPVQNPFRQIANAGYFNYLLAARLSPEQDQIIPGLLPEAQEKTAGLINGIEFFAGYRANRDAVLVETRAGLEALLSIPIFEQRYPLPGSRTYPTALAQICESLEKHPDRWPILIGWVFTRSLGRLTGQPVPEYQSQAWMDEWGLARLLQKTYQELGYSEETAWKMSRTVHLLNGRQGWFEKMRDRPLREVLEQWLSIGEIQQFLGVNRYQDILWFNQQALEEFCDWLLTLTLLTSAADVRGGSAGIVENMLGAYDIVSVLQEAAADSQYQLSRLLKALE